MRDESIFTFKENGQNLLSFNDTIKNRVYVSDSAPKGVYGDIGIEIWFQNLPCLISLNGSIIIKVVALKDIITNVYPYPAYQTSFNDASILNQLPCQPGYQRAQITTFANLSDNSLWLITNNNELFFVSTNNNIVTTNRSVIIGLNVGMVDVISYFYFKNTTLTFTVTNTISDINSLNLLSDSTYASFALFYFENVKSSVRTVHYRVILNDGTIYDSQNNNIWFDIRNWVLFNRMTAGLLANLGIVDITSHGVMTLQSNWYFIMFFYLFFFLFFFEM